MSFRSLAAILALAAAGGALASERVIDVATPRGATVRVLVATPDTPPLATALLFAGGHGGLSLGPDGSFGWGRRNFVVRVRERFVARGIATVVVDAPSDRRELGSFRTTRDHAEDVGAVVRWAREALSAPVWLVGTSRGTLSVANAAVRLGPPPAGADGVVLTSVILEDRHGDAVLDQDLGKIHVPVLAVQHRDDACPLCAPSLLGRLERKLASAPRREVIVLAGGVSEGPACEALAHHGFNGVEEEAVAAIARFVTAGERPAPPPDAPPDQRAR